VAQYSGGAYTRGHEWLNQRGSPWTGDDFWPGDRDRLRAHYLQIALFCVATRLDRTRRSRVRVSQLHREPASRLQISRWSRDGARSMASCGRGSGVLRRQLRGRRELAGRARSRHRMARPRRATVPTSPRSVAASADCQSAGPGGCDTRDRSSCWPMLEPPWAEAGTTARHGNRST